MIRSIQFAALYIGVASANEDALRQLRGGEIRIGRELTTGASCDTFNPIDYECATKAAIRWRGGGPNSEWLNVDNWTGSCLPGTGRFNRLVMAGVNDHGTVHCPATYMTHDVQLEMRARATLDVSTDLNIGRKLTLKTGATLTQSSLSIVTVGALHLAANYELSEQAQLKVVGEGISMKCPSNGSFTIQGDSSSVAVSGATKSLMYGTLKYVLGLDGAGLFTVDGLLSIGSSAKIFIEASAYKHDGNAMIQLIKYTSSTSSFNPENIQITGVAGGWTSQIKSLSDGVYLELLQQDISPTVTQTVAPTPTQTVAPTPTPTDIPIGSPVTSEPTKSPVITVTATPTDAPVSSAIPTNVPQMTTLITLGATGKVNTIMPTADCPHRVTDKLWINGSAYSGTAKAGVSTVTVTLYQCAEGLGFNPMNIQLFEFPEGFWFEIVDGNNNNIDLVIKSLTDYNGYYVRPADKRLGGYNNEEAYPPQTSKEQEHFPEFSWDSIPKWINFRKGKDGVFNDTEVENIANNNQISWYGVVSEKKIIEMARRIKRVNPDYKFILYWNSASYWGEEGDDLKGFNKDWWKFTLDRRGNRVYEFAKKANGKPGTRKLFNHKIPEMREWWVKYALRMIKDKDIDGVFCDATIVEEDTFHSDMIKELIELMPADSLKMGNFLRQKFRDGNRWRMDYAEGSYLENVHVGWVGRQPEGESLIASMQLAREALWKGKLIWWNGAPFNCLKNCVGGDHKVTKEKMKEYIKPTLAEYLIIAERYAYFNFSVTPDADTAEWLWNASTWMEEFDRPLGPPKGPPVQVGRTFTRHFEHVSIMLEVLSDDAQKNKVTYKWA